MADQRQKFHASIVRKQLQPGAASAIYQSQRELAISLELSYLHLADHPDVARESPKIIEKAFVKIIEQAEIMKKESEAAFSSSKKLQKELQENLAAVEETASNIKIETTRLKSEIEKELQMENDARTRLQQLEEEKKQLDKDLQSLTKDKDLRLKYANYLGLPVDADETFLDNISPRNGLFKEFLYLFRRIVMGVTKEEEEKRLVQEYRDVKHNYDETLTEQQTVENHMKETEEESHQCHAKMKDLRVQQEGFGNIKNIQKALKYLGQMDGHLSIIIDMWDDFAHTLKYMNERIKAGDVYIKMIEKEEFANLFKESISRAEEDWQLFAEICNGYVEENEEQIYIIYGFLSSPIDSMSDSDISDRKKKLLSSFKSDSVSVEEITVDSDAC
ncbi:uncharacterized protein LOC127841787 isoform X2 [Dreissena polymorpha]|uniref:uncharacterized protein LOC127841787 isoform X2 n=1 Tax=Dreissena polymorpha TaxID=45954 RepID=UPI0022643F77|nr:uncharacterized protein LOC127841787 isoform X2 [Dreissena polymorpha]